MRLHPLVLRITLPAKLSIHRRQHEPHMIVLRRIDQVPQLLLPRPASRPSIRPICCFFCHRAQVWQLPVDCQPQQHRQISRHAPILPRNMMEAAPTRMIRPGSLVKKLAILSHRWTGTAFCVLFLWWFVSGIFMMYCDYPEVKPSDRLTHAQPVDAARVRLTASEAWSSLHTKGAPDEVRLAT